MSQPRTLKPIGTWEVRRKIKIPALGHAADAMAVESALMSLSGVQGAAAHAAKRQAVVLYDATIIDYRSIELALVKTGFPPLDNRWSRFKGRWFQYSDTNARENANVRPSACCNKPPK